MALLGKLFGTKRNLDDAYHGSRDRSRSSKINPDQVRLLLFKECDWRGRKLLFDSCTIEQVSASKNDKPVAKTTEVPCIVEVSEGYSYVYKGAAADARTLGEMVFGAVALNHRGVSLKIHIMDDPRRLMCSKVFFVPNRLAAPDKKASAEQSCPDIRPDGPDSRTSGPLNVPSRDDLALSFSFDRGDSGFYGEHSITSSVSSTGELFNAIDAWDGGASQDDVYSFNSPSARKLSASSAGSWQRRTSRTLAARFELGAAIPPTPIGQAGSDSQMCSASSASSTTDSLCSAGTQRRTKLGLALLITAANAAEMDIVSRCIQHSPQLSALAARLRAAAMAAGRAGLVSALHRAAVDAATWLTDLVYGPRLQSSWLVAARGSHSGTAEALIGDICSVLTVGDTKHTNFFFSTLLTQVLTHHLGWVPTVSPYDAPLPPATTARPHNALWAQLNDLCGNIGFPPKAARTIISCTNNPQFVNRLLAVLTYFVRCGEVKRTDYGFKRCDVIETRVVKVKSDGLKRTVTKVNNLSRNKLVIPEIRTPDSSDTLVPCDEKVNFGAMEVSRKSDENENFLQQPMTSQLRRNQTIAVSLKSESNSSLNSSGSDEMDTERKVVFVLGDDEKLVGLKNKSIGGKSVKKSKHDDKVTKENIVTKDGDVYCKESSFNQDVEWKEFSYENVVKCNVIAGETVDYMNVYRDEYGLVSKDKDNYSDRSKEISEITDSAEISMKSIKGNDSDQTTNSITEIECVTDSKDDENSSTVTDCKFENEQKQTEVSVQSDTRADSPSKCCGQTQHSKPIKHSGFKFEFDKYPQIVTNYMKSKNLEILDRHYIGKPGNLKLDNFQFDPTVVPPIQEERCETCYKCQMMESMLQTPTNASELEFMNDIPRLTEPQFAKEITEEPEARKTFVHKKKFNTVLVNVTKPEENRKEIVSENDKLVNVKEKLEIPMLDLIECGRKEKAGFDESLLSGLSDHYVPDLILQGTLAPPSLWERALRRDLALEAPPEAIAIIADADSWEVRVVPRGGATGGGMSALVAAMLDALPHMRRARVPAHQCLSYLESKLREFCVLSKTLADMLMTTDFCDIETLTKSLNIDINDVPLLMAVATTHTPQVARRYGISYR